MKTISNDMLDLLISLDVESCYAVDLFTIVLESGLVIYATDGQMPITYEGNVYHPTRWGNWHCASTSCALGVMSASATVKIMATPDVMMPNWNVPLLEAVQLGLFDAATITITSSFSLSYGDMRNGIVVRFGGTITEIRQTGRTSAEADCKPDTFTLNQQMPRQVLQPGCRWVFGDAGCTIDKSLFTTNDMIGAGSTKSIIVPGTALGHPDGYFTQGVLKMTSGQNTGLSAFVKLHVSGNLQLNRPLLFPVNPGDTFSVIAGCDHTQNTCLQKFSNSINYGGQSYIPNTEFAI